MNLLCQGGRLRPRWRGSQSRKHTQSRESKLEVIKGFYFSSESPPTGTLFLQQGHASRTSPNSNLTTDRAFNFLRLRRAVLISFISRLREPSTSNIYMLTSVSYSKA